LLESTRNDDELWPTSHEQRLDAMRFDAGVVSQVRQFSLNSNSSAGTRANEREPEETAAAAGGDDGFEFDFVDLRTIGREPTRHLLVSFAARERRLTLASNDSELLVESIRLLVVERLQLSILKHSVDDKQSNGVELLLGQLEAINENSRQLEESERRIQTEIYESGELIKNLMQQLAIANELNEFGLSKGLLAEISMMLDGTHNSAHAFYLNNRSRLSLLKQANCLREKVMFLTGDDERPPASALDAVGG
jgi:hypothetical protein